MAMSVGPSEGEDEVVSAINTTPLVDVMLVLLIIFLITIPVVTHTIPVVLPKDRNQVTQTKPQNIVIAVTKDGDYYWNDRFVPDIQGIKDRLKRIAGIVPQPVVQIRGDAGVEYKFVGEVLFACQQVSIAKVGFIIDPTKTGS